MICFLKVNGEPRKKHMGTKWDQLISKSTKCVQDMLRLASQRRRNFIVDQVRSKVVRSHDKNWSFSLKMNIEGPQIVRL